MPFIYLCLTANGLNYSNILGICMYVCTPTIIIILAAHTENTVKIAQNFDGELLMNKFDEMQAKTMHPPAATYVFACKANPKFT